MACARLPCDRAAPALGIRGRGAWSGCDRRHTCPAAIRGSVVIFTFASQSCVVNAAAASPERIPLAVAAAALQHGAGKESSIRFRARLSSSRCSGPRRAPARGDQRRARRRCCTVIRIARASSSITHFIDDRLDVLEHLRGFVPCLYLFGHQKAPAPGWVTPVVTWPAALAAMLPELGDSAVAPHR
jgi:hypothetical protein